jgi:hypothetical protein
MAHREQHSTREAKKPKKDKGDMKACHTDPPP